MNEILNMPDSKLAALPEVHSDNLEKWKLFIGTRISDEREKAGLTQSQLADRTGITQSYICRLEKGEHRPTNKTLTKIATALEIPVSQLSPSA